MRVYVKFISFLLTFCMLFGSFAFFAFSEDVTSSESGENITESETNASESPFYDIVCSYDKTTSVIRVDFRMRNENVKKYEGSFISLYKLSDLESVESIENGVVSAVVTDIPVANKTGCELRQVGLSERLSRYVLSVKNQNGNVAFSETFYPSVTGNDPTHSFKGVELDNINDTLDTLPDTVVIDIPLEKLESVNGGYLYPTEHKTYTFGRAFLESLDLQMRVYSGVGVNVYLRFSESRVSPIISAGGYDNLSALYAYASFLSERYASGEYNGIAGIILGDSDSVQGDTEVEAYANSLYALLAALADGGYDSAVIVPISDRFSTSESFLERLCSNFMEAERAMFTVMVESSRNPFGINKEYTDSYDAIFYPDEFYGFGEEWSDDDQFDYDSRLEAGLPQLSSLGATNEYISSENLTRLFSLLRRLKNSTGCVSDNIIFNWQPSDDTVMNTALASLVYNFYKLLFTDRAVGFVLTLSESYDEQSRELLLNAIKYVDSDRSDKYIDKIRIASYFGAQNFEALVFGFSDSNTVKRNIYNYSTFKNKPANIVGYSSYFDFSETSSQSGWYLGSNCVSISSVKNNSLRYMSAKMLSAKDENAFLSYNYKYSESFKYTDFIAIEFSIADADPSRVFNLDIVLGGDGFTCEYKAYGFFPNSRYTVYLDTSSVNENMMTDYIRIGASSGSENATEYQLELYSIKALSKIYDNDQLTRLIESEHERLKSSADDALRSSIDYTALVFVVFVVLITFLVMFMIARKQRKNREKEQ